MKRFLLAAAAPLALLVPGAASAGVIIAPVAGVIDAGGPGAGSLSDTFNQSGLLSGYTAGVTDFDSYIATNPLHSIVFGGFEWFGNSGATSAQVTYDLGAISGIDALALWNEESAGIGVLDLLLSTDGISFASVGVFNPFNNPRNSNYGAEVFSFGATSARYVRFAMSGCPQAEIGSYPSCSIAEVAFRTADAVGGAVPEPATWALMILGMAGVGGAMRRRRATAAVSYA